MLSPVSSVPRGLAVRFVVHCKTILCCEFSEQPAAVAKVKDPVLFLTWSTVSQSSILSLVSPLSSAGNVYFQKLKQAGCKSTEDALFALSAVI